MSEFKPQPVPGELFPAEPSIAPRWVFLGYSECSACKARIEWWKTPKEARFCADAHEPLNLQHGGITCDPVEIAAIRRRTHWATCPKANQFSRRKRS